MGRQRHDNETNSHLDRLRHRYGRYRRHHAGARAAGAADRRPVRRGGNSLLCNTFPNTRRVVHLLGADYPVYPGAERPLVREPHVAGAFHGENGLGNVQLPLPDTAPEQTPAWDALYAAAKRMPASCGSSPRAR